MGQEEQAASSLRRIAPIYYVSAAVILGDALGNFRLWTPLWIAIVLGAGALIFLALSRPAFGVALALLGIAAAATVPVHRRLAPIAGPAGISRFADGSEVTVRGEVVATPELLAGNTRTRLLVAIKRVGKTADHLISASALVRITVAGAEKLRIGDEVVARARLFFPRNFGNPGEFDYEAYLRRQGIAATMFVPRGRGGALALQVVDYHPHFPASQIEAIRNQIGDFIDANLAGAERAEMRALVIGDRGGIDERLRSRFALTGMAHLLVISGLHLGFVAAAAFVLARLLLGFFPALMARGWGNKIAALASALAVTAYASIAGHHVSTIRALVMVLAYTMAIMIDRSREVLASLALAALVICIAFPGSTADISFQLSFASVAVIILGMRRFTAWWNRTYQLRAMPAQPAPPIWRIAEVIAGYFAVSFWALIGTAPLTAYHFNQFSLVGLVANAVVVPIMGFGATVCGLLAAALSFVLPSIAAVVLRAAGAMAGAGTWLAGWFLDWPLAWVRVFTPTIPELALVYGLLMLWFIRPAAESGDRDSLMNAVVPRWGPHWHRRCLAGLLVLLAIDAGWWTRERYFNPDLRVTFLSVGEGDAAVIRFPGSRVMLIDAGGAFRGTFDPGKWIVAPYLWSLKIMHVDDLVLSHPDRDHFGGFDFIARNFSPTRFWSSYARSTDVSYGELIATLEKARVRMRVVDASAPAMIIGGVRVECLGPSLGAAETGNNASLVMRLVFGRSAVLFTGDLEAAGERELLAGASAANLSATILKVPHHGSKTSSTRPFVEAVHPEVAVISLGYHNRFNFPAERVVDRYRAAGARVLRTDEVGAVSLDASSQGAALWTWRTGALRLPPAH